MIRSEIYTNSTLNNYMSSITSETSKILNAKRWKDNIISEKYDWPHLQRLHDEGMSIGAIRKQFRISYSVITKAFNLGLIISSYVKPTRRSMSEDTKSKISDKRKEWLKNNPDKHPWRNKDKHKSQPCESVKNFLRELNVNFVEEYMPNVEGRSFSIDIALPDKLIALEINGNQHYEKIGILKPYYQERHNLLESVGWTVYEIHYSACFKLSEWSSFVDRLNNTQTKVDFDYFTYVPKIKSKNLCECGKVICRSSSKCKKCNGTTHKLKHTPELDLINIEDLQKRLWEVSTVQLAKEYGLSDKGLANRIKKLGLTKPPRGYWAKSKK